MLGAHRRDGGIGHRRRDRLGGEPSRHVARGEHRMNARHRQRRRRIDRADAGVRMRAAHEGRMQRARQLDVVDEARTAGEQSGVFDPRHPRAELPRAHGSGPRAPVGGDIAGDVRTGRNYREFDLFAGEARPQGARRGTGAIRAPWRALHVEMLSGDEDERWRHPSAQRLRHAVKLSGSGFAAAGLDPAGRRPKSGSETDGGSGPPIG